jgi:hypothetical protein
MGSSEHGVPRQLPFLETSGHFRLAPLIYSTLVGSKIKMYFFPGTLSELSEV